MALTSNQPSSLADINIVLMNQIGNVGISVTDANGNPADATSLSLGILNMGGTPCWTDTYTPASTTIAAGSSGQTFPQATINVVTTAGFPDIGTILVATNFGNQSVSYNGTTPTSFNQCSGGQGLMSLGGAVTNATSGGSQIVHPYTGFYYYPFGTIRGQTYGLGEFLFNWQIQIAGNTPPQSIVQNVQVISANAMSHMPYLRLMIDKARKLVDPANDVFLGYTDAQLLAYLQGGCQWINAYQPELTIGFSPDTFPRNFRQIMLDAALAVGVMSQTLFAVDTDVPSYNDQGTAFVIQHAPQLAAYLNQVTAMLDKQIPAMKLQFLNSGTIHIEAGPNYRLAQLLQAAPFGALFRGVYFASPS
jgi:hypothetical protein